MALIRFVSFGILIISLIMMPSCSGSCGFLSNWTQNNLTFHLNASGDPNLEEVGFIADPSLLIQNGIYRMWFSAGDCDDTVNFINCSQRIAYTESTNIYSWQESWLKPTSPNSFVKSVLNPSAPFDALGTETPSVVQLTSINTSHYLMFYTADSAQEGQYSIARALSYDGGYTWTKSPSNTSFFNTDLPWEAPICVDPPTCDTKYGGLYEPSVIYDPIAKIYKLWYVSLGLNTTSTTYPCYWHIGYAESADAQTWVKHPDPVFTCGQTDAWDDYLVSHVNVLQDQGSGYHMFYFGSRHDQTCEGCAFTPGSIGHAFSEDGISWTRDPQNPVVKPRPGYWDGYTVGGPFAFFNENNTISLVYFAYATYNQSQVYYAHIGLATASCSNSTTSSSSSSTSSSPTSSLSSTASSSSTSSITSSTTSPSSTSSSTTSASKASSAAITLIVAQLLLFFV